MNFNNRKTGDRLIKYIVLSVQPDTHERGINYE